MFIRTLLLATKFLLMSDRADFWDPDTVSLDTEEMEMIGSKQSLFDFRQFRKKNILLLVHGFNNSPKDAIATYHQINNHLNTLQNSYGESLYDVIIGYLWPGGDSRFDYFSAERTADALANRVGFHLNALAFFSNRLDILAHSMGNRLILNGLNLLSLHNQQEKISISETSAIAWSQILLKAPLSSKHCFIDTLKNRIFRKNLRQKPIQNLYSLAAAVDNESIEKNEKYFPATQQCQNMYVFHSRKDDVLKYLFLLANRDRALGFKGPSNPDLTSKNIQIIDCSSLIHDHSGYFSSEPLYKFIRNQHTIPILKSEIARNVTLLETGLIQVLTENQGEFGKISLTEGND